MKKRIQKFLSLIIASSLLVCGSSGIVSAGEIYDDADTVNSEFKENINAEPNEPDMSENDLAGGKEVYSEANAGQTGSADDIEKFHEFVRMVDAGSIVSAFCLKTHRNFVRSSVIVNKFRNHI